jgi:hypothetical protein
MTKEELQKVREWADREIAAAELPSAWYQLMKLREALDAILGGIGALPVIISELSPEAPDLRHEVTSVWSTLTSQIRLDRNDG